MAHLVKIDPNKLVYDSSPPTIKLPTIQLLAKNGELCYPPNPAREFNPDRTLLLIHRYPEGDCDTISWPLRDKDRENLAACLFDDRECGTIQDQEVLLPDGTSAWGTVK